VGERFRIRSTAVDRNRDEGESERMYKVGDPRVYIARR
jgi:hypothetical protein